MSIGFQQVSEFFLLRDLEHRGRQVPDDERARVATAHDRAHQKRQAAEALWTAGSPAEALAIARDAVTILRGVDAAEPPPADLPELDRDVRPADAERFRAWLAEIDALAVTQRPRALDAAAIGRLRAQRIALAAAAVVATLGAVALLARTPRVLRAVASARYDAAHEAAAAVDGSEKTEWLLPDRSEGFLEVHVVPVRTVSRIKLLNARNPPWNDRATHEFHVDALLGDQVVKQLDGKFEGHSHEPTWRTFDLGARIDRVRITIKSHHGLGGGLGEVEID